MAASDDLIDWNIRWRIADHEVTCRNCHAQQSEADKGLMFEHAGECRYSGESRTPWADLDTICERLDEGG
jgi:hypothetical protein